jgi:predicted RNase H-like HicB family nuclease
MNFSAPPFSSTTEAESTYPVLVKHQEAGNWTAQVLGWSECKAEGATRQAALDSLYHQLAAHLHNAEIVSMTVPLPKPEHPWMKFAGIFKDDPYFDEVLEEIETYRRELDAEQEYWFEQAVVDEKAS